MFCMHPSFAEMSEHMVKDGFDDIVNIDNSSIVIEAMQKKYHNIPQLKCIHSLSEVDEVEYMLSGILTFQFINICILD